MHKPPARIKAKVRSKRLQTFINRRGAARGTSAYESALHSLIQNPPTPREVVAAQGGGTKAKTKKKK